MGFRTLLRCSARRERVACLGCLTRGLPHSYAIGSTCWWGDRGWGNPSVLTASPLSFSVILLLCSPPPPPRPPPPRRFRIDFPVALIFQSLLRRPRQRRSNADLVVSSGKRVRT